MDSSLEPSRTFNVGASSLRHATRDSPSLLTLGSASKPQTPHPGKQVASLLLTHALIPGPAISAIHLAHIAHG